jgi:hypothetical protein
MPGVRNSRERRALQPPGGREAAAPVGGDIVARPLAVPTMIANFGDHTGDEITLEEVEWITI